LVERELLDVRKELRTDDAPEAHCGARGKERPGDCAKCAADRYQQHHAALAQDVAGVVLDDAVVDDVSIQRRQVEVRQRLKGGEHQHDDDEATVRLQEAKETDHARALPSSLTDSVDSVDLAGIAGQSPPGAMPLKKQRPRCATTRSLDICFSTINIR